MTWHSWTVTIIVLWNAYAAWYRGAWLDTALVWSFTILILLGAYASRKDRRV